MEMNWALPYPARRQPILADNVVATSQPLATQAGAGETPSMRRSPPRSR